MPQKNIKTFAEGEKLIFDDEIYIEMMSALGCCLINGIMPLKMKEGLISAYNESGAIGSNYLYIDGKEIGSKPIIN